jgi:hypothetical protein
MVVDLDVFVVMLLKLRLNSSCISSFNNNRHPFIKAASEQLTVASFSDLHDFWIATLRRPRKHLFALIPLLGCARIPMWLGNKYAYTLFAIKNLRCRGYYRAC